MTKINVIVAGTVADNIHTVTVENELEPLQRLVGGYLEHTTLAELEARNIHLLVNEEGLLMGLDPNENLYPFFFVGNVVFVSTDGDEFASLSDEQHRFVMKWLEELG